VFKRWISFFFYFVIGSLSLFGQMPNADFSIPAGVCINENFTAIDNSQNIDTYQWDFCVGNFSASPIVDEDILLSTLGVVYGIKIITDGLDYFGFATGLTSNKLFRLEFGTDLDNIPSVIDLGTFSGILDQPEGIDIVKVGNQWVGIVGFGGNGGHLTRLIWDDLNSAPAAENIGSFGFTGRIRDLEIVVQNSDYILVFPYYNQPNLVRVNYGSSLLNTPSIPSDLFISSALTDVSLARGISVHQISNEWRVILASEANDGIINLDLGLDILSEPAVINSYFFPEIDRPLRIKILREGTQYFGLVSNDKNNIETSLIDFKGLLATDVPEIIGSFNPKFLAVAGIKNGSTSYFFGFSTNLSKLTFANPCFSIPEFTSQQDPNLVFTGSGNFEIDLRGYNSSNWESFQTQSIAVTALVAPVISISPSQNQCLTNPISFTYTSDQTLIITTWDFGDGFGTSTIPNPSYTYTSTGTYTVRLTVVSDNGCGQFIEKEITIYNSPVASFTVPGGLLCSNNPLQITNTSSFDPGSPTTWEWDFGDGTAFSNLQAPVHTYASEGNYTITLTAELPTCVSIYTVDVIIQEGPATSFTFQNSCNGDPIQFNDETMGTSSIVSWNWDFGNGDVSVDQSPSYTYPTPGTYLVTLTTSNLLGCSTFSTKTVINHSIPAALFSNELACARSATFFTDGSSVDNANIVSWEWDFGDGITSIEQNPNHIFDVDGTYSVSLTVTSNYGCQASVTSNIDVVTSADVAFSFDKSCLGDPTQFINETTTDASNPVTSTTWVIDGKIFTEQNPAYQFPQKGIYTVSLTVSTQNQCLVTYTRDISVNPNPTASFGYTQACGNSLVTFFDTSLAFDDDSIVARTWQIDGLVFANDSIVSTTPDTTGIFKISLMITTTNGCFSSTIENVDVLESPVSGFDMSTSIGAYPLQIDFINTSLAGTNFAWSFDADTTQSEELNPSYTFFNPGEYEVKLVTSNDLGCADTVVQMVKAVEPVYDVTLNQMNPRDTGNDRIQLILDIENPGSVTLDRQTLEIRIDLGTDIVLTEPFSDVLYAFQSTNYTLKFELDQEAQNLIPFICVELVPLISNESTSNKTACINFIENPIFMNPFPNPTTDVVKVGIVTPAQGLIILTWMDSNGKIFFQQEVSAQAGFNQIEFDVSTYMAGMYYLTVRYQDSFQTFKINRN